MKMTFVHYVKIMSKVKSILSINNAYLIIYFKPGFCLFFLDNDFFIFGSKEIEFLGFNYL